MFLQKAILLLFDFRALIDICDASAADSNEH